MIAITRFADQGPDFATEAAPVISWWSARAGCLTMDLVQNLDDHGLWAIVSRWESVGAYRKSFNGYDAKMILTPLLSRAVDEPSAFLPPSEVGFNVPRGEV